MDIDVQKNWTYLVESSPVRIAPLIAPFNFSAVQAITNIHFRPTLISDYRIRSIY